MRKKAEFKKTMTIEQVLSINPNAAPILMGFGMHCLGCPMSRMESLEQAAGVHGFDVELLIEKLNELNK